jgi:hypothetical protein
MLKVDGNFLKGCVSTGGDKSAAIIASDKFSSRGSRFNMQQGGADERYTDSK